MDPVTLVVGAVAVTFFLLAVLQWRRAGDLEDRVRELEAQLAEREPLPRDEPIEREPVAEPEAEPEPEPEPEPEAEPEAEVEAEAEPEAEVEAEPDPEPEPAPKKAEPDPRRMLALKIVNESFETCRYLDFDAIVEKPSTYRVTVPITAANGDAVRYLEDGMFPCLKKVMLEDDKAVLHIDMSKGPP